MARASVSSYPAREIYFDDVEIASADAEECRRTAARPHS
jgi:hypothetical protein